MSDSQEARAVPMAGAMPLDSEEGGIGKVDLTPIERAQLDQIARSGSPQARRRARIVLARAEGCSLKTIARREGLHRDSVRRSLIRFAQYGIAGLPHGNSGQAHNVTFTATVREEIRRRARLEPRSLGELFTTWSLYKLRDHLLREGIVQSISVERLRQLVASEREASDYWQRRGLLVTQLRAAHRSELRGMTGRVHATDKKSRGRVAQQNPRPGRPSNLQRWPDSGGGLGGSPLSWLPDPRRSVGQK